MPEHRIGRVLMTGDTVGGVWSFNLELARALGAHGIEVVLATMGGTPIASQRAEAASIPNLRHFGSRFKLEWMEDPWENVEESGRWLLGLEREFKPDIVHLNSYGHGALPWRAPVLLTGHSCVLSWWSAVRKESLPQRWTRYRTEVECALKGADMVTAPSHAMLRALEENYSSCLPACRVVENGRCASGFRAAEKEPFVLAAGRLWDEAKNSVAVARIAGRIPWPVYMAGEDRHPGGKPVDLGGCNLLGRLSAPDLAGWYSRAAIFAHPARYEPFGLCAIEAALSGCALVLGDIDSLREVWDDSAVFVPPDDTGALEATLQDLIADTARRRELAERAAARARIYSPERMARGYMDAYSWLAAARRVACAS